MQSKISTFFKPSSSSSSSSSSSYHSAPSKPPDPARIVGDGDDELAIWEKTEHEIVNTYKRRAPRTDGKNEANEGSISDTVKKPVSEDLLPRSEFTVSARTVNKKRSYAQFYLELGQSDFLLHTCSTCGIKYAPGDEGDEKNHNTFHKNYTHGVQFKGWPNERVVHVPCTKGGHVISVLGHDPPAQRNKVQEIVKMMEMELGEGWILHKLCKVYLFISSHRVAGCLIAEPIKEAFKVISCSVGERCQGANAKETRINSATLQFGEITLRREFVRKGCSAQRLGESGGYNSGAILCEKKASPAVCGIRAIWVTPSNRRKGVATSLLDALRRSFYMGFVLEKSQLAFSQPSSAGKALALNYFGTESLLVYKADNSSY